MARFVLSNNTYFSKNQFNIKPEQKLNIYQTSKIQNLNDIKDCFDDTCSINSTSSSSASLSNQLDFLDFNSMMQPTPSQNPTPTPTPIKQKSLYDKDMFSSKLPNQRTNNFRRTSILEPQDLPKNYSTSPVPLQPPVTPIVPPTVSPPSLVANTLSRNNRRKTIELKQPDHSPNNLDSSRNQSIGHTEFIGHFVSMLASITYKVSEPTRNLIEEIITALNDSRCVSPEHFGPFVIMLPQFDRKLAVPAVSSDQIEVILTLKTEKRSKVTDIIDGKVDLNLVFPDINFDDIRNYPLSLSFSEI